MEPRIEFKIGNTQSMKDLILVAQEQAKELENLMVEISNLELEIQLPQEGASNESAPLSELDKGAIKGAVIQAALSGHTYDLKVLTDDLIESFKRISRV